MFIDIDADAAREPEIVERGEYEVQVLGVDEEVRTSQTGNQLLTVRLAIVGVPYAQDIYYNLFLPNPDKDERNNNKRLLRWKQFIEAVGLEKTDSGYNLQEATGRTARAVIDEERDQDDMPRNRLVRFIPER